MGSTCNLGFIDWPEVPTWSRGNEWAASEVLTNANTIGSVSSLTGLGVHALRFEKKLLIFQDCPSPLQLSNDFSGFPYLDRQLSGS